MKTAPPTFYRRNPTAYLWGYWGGTSYNIAGCWGAAGAVCATGPGQASPGVFGFSSGHQSGSGAALGRSIPQPRAHSAFHPCSKPTELGPRCQWLATHWPQGVAVTYSYLGTRCPACSPHPPSDCIGGGSHSSNGGWEVPAQASYGRERQNWREIGGDEVREHGKASRRSHSVCFVPSSPPSRFTVHLRYSRLRQGPTVSRARCTERPDVGGPMPSVCTSGSTTTPTPRKLVVVAVVAAKRLHDARKN